MLCLVIGSPNFNNRQMSICRVIYKLVQKFRYCDSYPMVFQGPMFSFIHRPVLNDCLAENILSAPCVAQKTITSEFIILTAVWCYILIIKLGRTFQIIAFGNSQIIRHSTFRRKINPYLHLR